MNPITEAQLTATFVTISATLDNTIQTMSTLNQRLDRVVSRLTPTAREVEESDSTA